MGGPPSSFAVVIPARNEAALVGETIAAVAVLPEIDMVAVVDDGSTDATAPLAEANGAMVVRHVRRRGKAAALMTGVDLVVRSTSPTERDRRDCCSSMPTQADLRRASAL
ncbi:MAG TPA: glycosyltransferase [Acidimicrobiales bacterium]|nr:glycosyltransferase [Acidimicrobiales bacterium]